MVGRISDLYIREKEMHTITYRDYHTKEIIKQLHERHGDYIPTSKPYILFNMIGNYSSTIDPMYYPEGKDPDVISYVPHIIYTGSKSTDNVMFPNTFASEDIEYEVVEINKYDAALQFNASLYMYNVVVEDVYNYTILLESPRFLEVNMRINPDHPDCEYGNYHNMSIVSSDIDNIESHIQGYKDIDHNDNTWYHFDNITKEKFDGKRITINIKLKESFCRDYNITFKFVEAKKYFFGSPENSIESHKLLSTQDTGDINMSIYLGNSPILRYGIFVDNGEYYYSLNHYAIKLLVNLNDIVKIGQGITNQLMYQTDSSVDDINTKYSEVINTNDLIACGIGKFTAYLLPSHIEFWNGMYENLRKVNINIIKHPNTVIKEFSSNSNCIVIPKSDIGTGWSYHESPGLNVGFTEAGDCKITSETSGKKIFMIDYPLSFSPAPDRIYYLTFNF